MPIRPVSYKNSLLWKKSEELVSKAGLISPSPEEMHQGLFFQVKNTLASIQKDIKQAYGQTDHQVVLYYFSKTKSSCMILEGMLVKIVESIPLSFYSEWLSVIEEMKSILDNYIRLSQINIIIEKKREEKK